MYLKLSPAPDMLKRDNFSLRAWSLTLAQALEVWEGDHSSLLLLVTSGTGATGFGCSPYAVLCFAAKTYPAQLTRLWQLHLWGQGDGRNTAFLLPLNFSVVDLNQLVFRPTLQLGYLCLFHKWFIWPWPLWILSFLSSLRVNLWEGARCPAAIPGLAFWGLCRDPADCPKHVSRARLCHPSAKREQGGICE